MNFDFKKEFETAVIGGGIGGCAAALQSARCGRKTVLLEKQCVPGGLATSGLVYFYLPLCDGNGRQVTFGIAEELLHNSMTLGPGEIPANWKNERNAVEPRRYRCTFSPASFMVSLEKLLLDAGVEIWYDTRVCDAALDHGKITAVTVSNESGFGQIKAGCFIDASGTCTVAHRAGLPCIEENNVMTIWAMEYVQGARRDWQDNLDCFTFATHSLAAGNSLRLSPENREKFYPGLTDEEIFSKAVCRGSSGKIVSDFLIEGRRILFERYKDADRNAHFPVKLPGMPQFRKIRCIEGEYVLQENDGGREFPDSCGLLTDWRKPASVWELPFRTLYPKNGIAGLLCAGRCSAAIGDAWEVTRVIPSAALSGQVCGLAAHLSLKTGKEIPELDVKLVQEALAAEGIIFHENA